MNGRANHVRPYRDAATVGAKFSRWIKELKMTNSKETGLKNGDKFKVIVRTTGMPGPRHKNKRSFAGKLRAAHVRPLQLYPFKKAL